MPGTAERRICFGRPVPARERGDDRDPRDRPGRTPGGEVRRCHGQRHGGQDHDPGQGGRGDQVVSALLQMGSPGQPGGEAEDESRPARREPRRRCHWPAAPGGCACRSLPWPRPSRWRRRRRCASTVKPPTETSAMSSMPRVANVSTTVSGLSTLLWLANALVVKSGPSEFTTLLGPSKRTSTWVGDGTCPGGYQREIVQQALRVLRPGRRRDGTRHPSARRLLCVDRGSTPGPESARPGPRPGGSVLRAGTAWGGRRDRLGSWARRSKVATEPGTVIVSFSMTSVAPKRCADRGHLRRKIGDCGTNVAMESAVPKPKLAGGGVFTATVAPTTVAATATSTSMRMRTCWRHSRRNRRQAQRTMARRAGTPPPSSGPNGPVIGPGRGREKLPGSGPATSDRRSGRRAGKPPGPPTTPAGRRG